MEKWRLRYLSGVFFGHTFTAPEAEAHSIASVLSTFPLQRYLGSVHLDAPASSKAFHKAHYITNRPQYEFCQISALALIQANLVKTAVGRTRKASNLRLMRQVLEGVHTHVEYWHSLAMPYGKAGPLRYFFYAPDRDLPVMKIKEFRAWTLADLIRVAGILDYHGDLEIYASTKQSVFVPDIVQPVKVDFIRDEDGAGGVVIVDQGRLDTVTGTLTGLGLQIVSKSFNR